MSGIDGKYVSDDRYFQYFYDWYNLKENSSLCSNEFKIYNNIYHDIENLFIVHITDSINLFSQ